MFKLVVLFCKHYISCLILINLLSVITFFDFDYLYVLVIHVM